MNNARGEGKLLPSPLKKIKMFLTKEEDNDTIVIILSFLFLL